MKIEVLKERFQTLRTVLERQIVAHFKKQVIVDLKLVGECAVSNKRDVMMLGLQPDELSNDWETIRNIIRFKFHHELQHCLSTNPQQFQMGILDCSNVFQNAGIREDVALQWARILINGQEDGRIENIMVKKFKGILPLRNWYRLQELQKCECTCNDYPIETALWMIHSIACRGTWMKGFSEICPKGDPTREMVEKLIPLVKACVTAPTTAVLRSNCMEIAKELCDLLEDDEDHNDKGEDKEGQDSSDSQDQSEDNRNSSKQPGESEIQNLAQKLDVQFSDENIASIDKGDFKEMEQSNKKIENVLPEQENSQNSADNNGSGQTGETSDSDTGNPNGDSLDEQAIDELLKQLEDAIRTPSELLEQQAKELEQAKAMKVKQVKPSDRDANPKPLSQRIQTEIEERHQDPLPKERPYNKSRWEKYDLPAHLSVKADKVREEVKKTLASDTEENTIEGLYEGSFDETALSNLCIGSFDIYKEISDEKDTVWYDILFLCDNSGSMYSLKPRLGQAMGLIEDIVKGVPGISLKIVDYSDRKHGIIKNWDENDMTYNYSHSYGQSGICDGGQYDSTSLDYYVTELQERPSASGKMLILLTDGEPCVPREELQEITTRARTNGITLLVFFIGYSPDYIQKHPDRYENMYGKGSCYAVPSSCEGLDEEFLKLLKASIRI